MQSGAAVPFSVLYFGPIKALCTEMLSNFKSKFESTSLATVAQLTGDVDLHAAPEKGDHHVTGAQIICATPEKFDAFTRNWDVNLHANVSLILIDEIHLLHEERGATLETAIARLKMRVPGARILAASATVCNPADVANWLGAEYRVYGDEFRPVPLVTKVCQSLSTSVC